MTHTYRNQNRRTRYNRALRHLETLEPRTLLSAAVSNYVLSGAYAGLGVYDSSGALWVYDQTYVNSPDSNGALLRVTDGAVSSVIAMDTSTYSPAAFAAGGGFIYAADFLGADGYGAIDIIDTATGTITSVALDAASEYPFRLTVTDNGSVWFLNFSSDNSPGVGRMDPGTQAVSWTALPADSTIGLIASSGMDSVWIGAGAIETYEISPAEPVTGYNRIIVASFDGDISTASYLVNTGDATADKYNTINGLATDPTDGSVWFTLSNSAGANRSADQRAPDQIVHGVLTANGTESILIQTSYAGTNTANQPLNYAGLAFDSEMRLWYFQWHSSQFGYLDTNTLTYSDPNYTTTNGSLDSMVARADGTQISILTAGSAIIQIDVSTVSDTPLNVTSVTAVPIFFRIVTVFASFTDDADLGLSTWTATIDWGDHTSSTGLIVRDPTQAGRYFVVAFHRYSARGTYDVTLTVNTSEVGGTVTNSTLSTTVTAR